MLLKIKTEIKCDKNAVIKDNTYFMLNKKFEDLSNRINHDK